MADRSADDSSGPTDGESVDAPELEEITDPEPGPTGDAVAQPWWRRRRRRLVTLALAMVLLVAIGYLGRSSFQLWQSWRNIDRLSLDSEAYAELPVVPAEAESGVASIVATAEPDENAAALTEALPDELTYSSYLIVGSDHGDLRADVIILVMLPSDGGSPIMVSLPRDLYLPNRCQQQLTRLNANFNGCGQDINGATLLSGAVEDFTGVTVDHYALFTFEGFERIIDEVGGIEICNDHPIRDRGADLDMAAGCTQADGELALKWVQSRKTQELVDGRWRPVPNVSDLTRNQRQQDLILTVFAKVSDFDSPDQLADQVASLSDAFTIDDQLGLREAVDLAWELRGLDPSSVIRFEIPVRDHVTEAGAQVLIPTAPFAEVFAEAVRTAATP